MPKQTAERRVLLIGNGLNRVGRDRDNHISWDDMIREFEEPLAAIPDYLDDGRMIPSLFRMQRTVNYMKDIQAVYHWINSLDNMDVCDLHRALAQSANAFSAIITTNYDHVMEKSLGITVEKNTYPDQSGNLYRRQGKVYHPHGEVGNARSILFCNTNYQQELARMCSFESMHDFSVFNASTPTWLDWFIHSELHICGITFGYDELTLWHALQKRLEICGNDSPSAYFYRFVDERDEHAKMETQSIASMFASFGVECINIMVHDGQYERAWRELFGPVHLNLERLAAHERNSKKMATSKFPNEGGIHEDLREQFTLSGDPRPQTDQPEKATPNIPTISLFKNPRIGYNVTTTSKPASNNRERCWINVLKDKLQQVIERGGKWIFDCEIDDIRYTYAVDGKELFRALEDGHSRVIENPDRYSCYLDYCGGKLYRELADGYGGCLIAMMPLEIKDFENNLIKLKRGKKMMK